MRSGVVAHSAPADAIDRSATISRHADATDSNTADTYGAHADPRRDDDRRDDGRGRCDDHPADRGRGRPDDAALRYTDRLAIDRSVGRSRARRQDEQRGDSGNSQRNARKTAL
jgi:hypothetical protein